MKREVFQKLSIDDLKKYDDAEKGVIVYDENGNIIYANKQALVIFGYPSIEDLSNGWKLIPPEYKTIIQNRIERALLGEPSPSLTLRVFTGDRRAEIIKSKTFPVILDGKRAIMAVFAREVEDRFRRNAIKETLKIIKKSVEPFLENRTIDIKEIMECIYESIKSIFSHLDLVFVKKNMEVLFATAEKVPCVKNPPIAKCMEEKREIYISSSEIDGKIYTIFASPIFVGGEVFGAIGFRKEGYGAFSPEDVEMFRVVSELVSLILKLSKKIEDIEKEKEDLFTKVMIDDLTGSYTRNYLNEFAEKIVSYFKRRGESVSVVMMDIDNLKLVNDNYGHLEGDKLLNDFSRIVMENIRETDLLIRLGGDEFLLILPGCGLEDAEKVMRKIVDDVKKENTERDPKIHFSYGIALVDSDLRKAIEIADNRMYTMKRIHHSVL